MNRLRKIIKLAFADPDQRLAIHDARSQAAEAMGKDALADVLLGKAVDAVTRSSSNPHVTLTPEQAVRIAVLLRKKK